MSNFSQYARESGKVQEKFRGFGIAHAELRTLAADFIFSDPRKNS
jgi:hypothetical protein